MYEGASSFSTRDVTRFRHNARARLTISRVSLLLQYVLSHEPSTSIFLHRPWGAWVFVPEDGV